MAGYKPTKIAGFSTGLVEGREAFILVEDAFPVLENAYTWRERIRKKLGKRLVGRLRRVLTAQALTNTAAASTYTDADIFTTLSLRATEANAQFNCGTLVVTLDDGGPNVTVITDQGDGTLDPDVGNLLGVTVATINYSTGALSVTFAAPIAGGLTVTAAFSYFPGLPVMGIRQRELANLSAEDTVCFDTKYAYVLAGGAWVEFIAGTTWTGSDSQFFDSANYWVDSANARLFWVTNFNKLGADPMRYTNGTTWTSFAPLITATDSLYQARGLVPFRGRLLAFDTYEGSTGLVNATQYPQRIRWSQIGTPIAADSWLTDKRGKGGFLDIPTSQEILAWEFVRDNLIVVCERSTWQLRYTGRSVQPFQVEKVNTELGTRSQFSIIPFDRDVLYLGDRRITKCDSFAAEPVDIKIPDFAIEVENGNAGRSRVQGIRDIPNRLAYWTVPYSDHGEYQATYPQKRLVYNYENDSWATFTDSITALGLRWLGVDITWDDVADLTWEQYQETWTALQADEPVISGGNQQGYIHDLDQLTTDEVSLFLQDVTGRTPDATRLTVPSHNLRDGMIVDVSNIPAGTPFATALNGNTYSVVAIDADNVDLYIYNAESEAFSEPQVDADGDYVGCGELAVVDNFRVVTKKFSHLDEGKQIQVGYIDVLTTASEEGTISARFFVDYDSIAANIGGDTFYNTQFQTYPTALDIPGASRYWRRVFATTVGNFVQVEFTFSAAEMATNAAKEPVEIHGLVLWERPAGPLTF